MGSRVFTITAHGKSYKIEANPKGRIGSVLANGLPYEQHLLEHIYELNLMKRVAVDVGASIGNHTLWLAVVCGFSVSAFEPVFHKELLTNIALNPGYSIEVVKGALGATVSTAEYLGKGQLQIGSGLIRITKLDDWDLQGIALIKIDVEGMELAVLRGAEETIKRERPLLFIEARDPADHDALSELLTPWGYRFVLAARTATRVERWDPV